MGRFPTELVSLCNMLERGGVVRVDMYLAVLGRGEKSPHFGLGSQQTCYIRAKCLKLISSGDSCHSAY